MDPNLRVISEFRVEHGHGDGTWQRMEPVQHDPGENKPERDWRRWTIFHCPACNQTVTVATGGDQAEVADESH